MRKRCRSCNGYLKWSKVFAALHRNKKVTCAHCMGEVEVSLFSKCIYFFVSLAPVFTNLIVCVKSGDFIQIGKLPLTTTYMIWYWLIISIAPFLILIKSKPLPQKEGAS
ncbi:hypothetical protein HMPREF1207_04054 [Paenibacillus sp. HGH0039]|nr:hypothetical protein HMPREF1207_04054 [Paenibacillus sp. HGH0039]